MVPVRSVPALPFCPRITVPVPALPSRITPRQIEQKAIPSFSNVLSR